MREGVGRQRCSRRPPAVRLGTCLDTQFRKSRLKPTVKVPENRATHRTDPPFSTIAAIAVGASSSNARLLPGRLVVGQHLARRALNLSHPSKIIDNWRLSLLRPAGCSLDQPTTVPDQAASPVQGGRRPAWRRRELGSGFYMELRGPDVQDGDAIVGS